jgi:hypothetical protein
MLRLGVIGLSPGNGHPYSWSAICNGYNPAAMADCPFPAIPDYLSQHRFPDEFLRDVRVHAVWCQDRESAEHVAHAARIPRVVDRLEDLAEDADGILLARDDFENHARFSHPFLAAGCPIFIDKPLATTLGEADALLAEQRHPAQIHTCSAFRYIPEVSPVAQELAAIGPIKRVEASVGKAWATYSVHLLEPAVRLLAATDADAETEVIRDGDAVTLRARWADGRALRVTTTGEPAPADFRIHGSRRTLDLRIQDPFFYFKAGLQAFMTQIRTGVVQVPRAQTRATVALIERGMDGVGSS